MEGNIMKKELTYEQALQMLKRGEAVTCQLSKREDDLEVVKEISRLEYLSNLNKEDIQKCKIYRIPKTKIKFSENEIEVSFDEAYKMICSGKLVYYKEDGKEDEITTPTELMNIRRRLERNGKNLILYWHE